MLSNINGTVVKKVWHKKFFDASKAWLSEDEYQAMVDELNRIVLQSIDELSDIVVSSFIPGSDWGGTVWDSIYYKACAGEYDHAAQFFGLLVCQVLIDRSEQWYFIKQESHAKGMIYFMSQKDKKKVSDQEESLINKDKKEVFKQDKSAKKTKAAYLKELWESQ